MSLVTSKLYVGDINDARNLDFLRSKNVNTIVNCTTDIDNFHAGKFNYMKLGLLDTPDQDLTRILEPVSSKIIETIKDGRVVFVHCYAGISRSTSIVIYTLMKLHDWTFEKAFRYVKMMHPRTNPNDGFIEQLVGRNSTNDSHVNTSVIEQQQPIQDTEMVHEKAPKNWSNMRLDSPEDKLPEYAKPSRSKSMYAKIFSSSYES